MSGDTARAHPSNGRGVRDDRKPTAIRPTRNATPDRDVHHAQEGSDAPEDSSYAQAAREDRPTGSGVRALADEARPFGPDSDGSVAPNDLDAEGIALAHALEHGPIDGLLPKHFYATCNARIYEAVRILAVRGEPVDVIAVKRLLQADGRLAQVGGTPYLGMLVSTQPAASGAHMAAHVEAIREFYRRRVLSDAALRLRVELRTGACSAGEAWARFKTICDELSEA